MLRRFPESGRAGSMAPTPPDLMPHQLSRNSLYQLERNGDDFSSSRHSRVKTWVNGLANGATTPANSLINVNFFGDDIYGPFEYFPGFGQGPDHKNTVSQASSAQVNNSNTAIYQQPQIVRRDQSTDNIHVPIKTMPSASQAPKGAIAGNGLRRQPQIVQRDASTRNSHPPSRTLTALQAPKNAFAGNSQASQPPSKKVFTEKHSQAMSTSYDLDLLSSTNARPPSHHNVPTSASAIGRKIRIDTKEERAAKNEAQIAKFCTKMQSVFPDICDGYVRGLFDKYATPISDAEDLTAAIELALEDILSQSSYPKKTQRKRKRVDDNDVKQVQSNSTYYFPIVVKLLQRQYTLVHKATIERIVVRHKTLRDALIALFQQFGRPSADASDYRARLHQVRAQHPPHLVDVLEHEMQEAETIIAGKEDAKRKENEARQERINEEKNRLAGTLVECQCCFSEVPSNRVVPCEGDEVHLFCNSCIRTSAETQVGQMRYELKCFDVSGCQATFNSRNIRAVLGDKLMKKLEDLQQMDEIAKASIDGLEECPFCDFKAICPPVEQDKEFNCQNPECEKISCRLCKENTHIPLSCKEAKAAKNELGRHAVEEAMTSALIRKCPKCAVSIIKDGGCNRVICQRCNTVICDVCKSDITKEQGYNHFNSSNSRCLLHEKDTGTNRRMKEVAQAEKAAMESILAKDAGIDREMLRVTKKDSSEEQSRLIARTGAAQVLPRFMVAIPGQAPQAMIPLPNLPIPPMPQIPQMPPMVWMPQIPQMLQMPQVPPVPPVPQWPQIAPAAGQQINRRATVPHTRPPAPAVPTLRNQRYPQRPVYHYVAHYNSNNIPARQS